MKLFNECLEEAKGLVKTKPRNEFMPALDDLVNDDIESIVIKVQMELDLADEGEIVTHYQTKRKAEAFIEKWEAVLEKEEVDEAFDFENVSLKEHQKELVIGLGFNQDITQEVMDGLKKRGTKVAEDVLDRMKRLVPGKKYTVLTDGQEVRIASSFLVTQKEKKQIESVAGMKVANKIHDGIEWLVWLYGEDK